MIVLCGPSARDTAIAVSCDGITGLLLSDRCSENRGMREFFDAIDWIEPIRTESGDAVDRFQSSRKMQRSRVWWLLKSEPNRR